MVRIATGMSFGPMAMSATTPISAISDQAKSNTRKTSKNRPRTGARGRAC